MTLGPLLGSFITGPAAMTICALLLRHRFYSLKPSERLKYATLGLLFVNISVGGVLTQFGSPPVVIAASTWNWDLPYMLTHFGWKAVIGIILSNLLYLTVFRREFVILAIKVPDEEQDQERRRPIPWRITGIHILFLCWTVVNAHYSSSRDPGSSFLSRLRLSHATEPADDCPASTITRRPLSCSPNHSRRVPAMVDRACSRRFRYGHDACLDDPYCFQRQCSDHVPCIPCPWIFRRTQRCGNGWGLLVEG